MKLRIFAWIILFFAGQFAIAQPGMSDWIGVIESDETLKGAGLGIAAVDLATGAPLAKRDAALLLVPASTLKLLTSAAALEILGGGYRFRTEAGYRGEIKPSELLLAGDLVVKGGGDPALGSEWFPRHYSHPSFLQKWAEAVKDAGIRRITGNIVVDLGSYQTEVVPGTWVWEDLGNYYGAAPSGVNYADNTVRLFFRTPARAGQPAELIRVSPEIPGVKWKNEVRSSTDPRDLAYVFGSPLDDHRLITGTIPAGQTAFEVKAAMPDPPRVLGQMFAEALLRAGVLLEGKIIVSEEPVEMKLLAVTESPRLDEIVSYLNAESINLFAEQLVCQVAREKTGVGSWQKGLEMIQDFWRERGINEPFYMADGSGLSRFSGLSAQQMVAALTYMNNQAENGAAFKQSLPAAGEGTLYLFDPARFPNRSLRCKSGSMTRVRCYAGYLRCNSGREVAFAVFVNNFSGSQAGITRKIERLLSRWRENW